LFLIIRPVQLLNWKRLTPGISGHAAPLQDHDKLRVRAPLHAVVRLRRVMTLLPLYPESPIAINNEGEPPAECRNDQGVNEIASDSVEDTTRLGSNCFN
jgi:hypothetical protein